MLTTRRQNRIAVGLLIALFLLVGFHVVLYTKDQAIIENPYHSSYWDRMVYRLVLLAILGEIGFLLSANILVKAVCFLLSIPNGVFSLMLLQLAQLDGDNRLLPPKSYYDYLILVPLLASFLTSMLLAYITFSLLFQNHRSLGKE